MLSEKKVDIKVSLAAVIEDNIGPGKKSHIGLSSAFYEQALIFLSHIPSCQLCGNNVCAQFWGTGWGQSGHAVCRFSALRCNTEKTIKWASLCLILGQNLCAKVMKLLVGEREGNWRTVLLLVSRNDDEHWVFLVLKKRVSFRNKPKPGRSRSCWPWSTCCAAGRMWIRHSFFRTAFKVGYGKRQCTVHVFWIKVQDTTSRAISDTRTPRNRTMYSISNVRPGLV